jgi:hypothetical protein
MTNEERREFGDLDLFQESENQSFEFEFDEDEQNSILDRYKSELKSLQKSSKYHCITLMFDFKIINTGSVEINTEKIIWISDDICYEFVIKEFLNSTYKQLDNDELIILTLEGGKSVQFKFETKATAIEFNHKIIDTSNIIHHIQPKVIAKTEKLSETTLKSDITPFDEDPKRNESEILK